MLTSRSWIPGHPDLSVDARARRVAMSPRTFPVEIAGRGPPQPGKEAEETAASNEIRPALRR